MATKDDIDYDIGTYKCEGAIEHFKLRICLEISRTSFHHKNINVDKKHKRIEKIFHWKEKVAEDVQDQNDLEDTSSSIEGKLLDSHLLTDVTHQNSNRVILHDIANRDNILTKSFRQMNELHINNKNNNIFIKKIIDHSPSDILKFQNRLPYSNQIMHVLLDLGVNNTESEENHHVLASFYWNPNSRILTVMPDFNNSNSLGYMLPISTVKDSCFEYRFWIENISTETLELQSDTFHLFKMDHYDFHVPDSDKINVLGEITSASGFEGDNLFVRYKINVPPAWKCMTSDDLLQGTTHTCRSNNNFTSIFTHLFNATIVIPKDLERLNINFAFITFEIYSIDIWGKERIEGYTSYIIPKNTASKSYHKNIKLDAWLPVSRNYCDDLRRYFIGSSVILAESNYISIPSSFNDKILSKFGMETKPRGTLNVTLSMIKQRHNVVDGNIDKTITNEGLSAQALVNSVNSVMASFKRARQRMLLACQPLLSPVHN